MSVQVIPGVMSRQLMATDRPRTIYEYVVEGLGAFPLDMLRYDSAWPADQETVSYIETRGRRKLRLRSYCRPTPERWDSFGWRVVR